MNTMEYIYAALTIHKAGGKIDEETLKKVLSAAGATADDSRVKALVAALDGVDIDDAVSKAAAAPAIAAAAAPAAAAATEAKAEAPKAEEKSDEEAAAGLGALFG